MQEQETPVTRTNAIAVREERKARRKQFLLVALGVVVAVYSVSVVLYERYTTSWIRSSLAEEYVWESEEALERAVVAEDQVYRAERIHAALALLKRHPVAVPLGALAAVLLPTLVGGLAALHYAYRERTREEKPVELPPPPDLRHDPEDAILIAAHRVGLDGKPLPEPEYVTLERKGQFGNVQVLGAIGSGKTSTVAYPVLSQYMSKHPAPEPRRPGETPRPEDLVEVREAYLRAARSRGWRAGRFAKLWTEEDDRAATGVLERFTPDTVASALARAVARCASAERLPVSALLAPTAEILAADRRKHVERKVGGLIIDIKGNTWEAVEKIARRWGREDDVVVIRPGGKWAFNPIRGTELEAVEASRIMTAFSAMRAASDHPFYRPAQESFIRNLILLHRFARPGKPYTMESLYRLLISRRNGKDDAGNLDPRHELMEDARQMELRTGAHCEGLHWFEDDWDQRDARERSSLIQGVANAFNLFVAPGIRECFSPDPESLAPGVRLFDGFDTAIDQGLVVVISVSVDEYGDLASALSILCMMEYQTAILRRLNRRTNQRTMFVLADECRYIVNPELPKFLSMSREALCSTWLLHQTRAQLDSASREIAQEIESGTRTKIVLPPGDYRTAADFAQLFGEEERWEVTGSNVSNSYGGVEENLLVPGRLLFRKGDRRASEVTSTSLKRGARVDATSLIELEPKTAVVRLFDGERSLPPKKVHLLPYYEDPGWQRFEREEEPVYRAALERAKGDAKKARALVRRAKASPKASAKTAAAS